MVVTLLGYISLPVYLRLSKHMWASFQFLWRHSMPGEEVKIVPSYDTFCRWILCRAIYRTSWKWALLRDNRWVADYETSKRMDRSQIGHFAMLTFHSGHRRYSTLAFHKPFHLFWSLRATDTIYRLILPTSIGKRLFSTIFHIAPEKFKYCQN